MPVADGHTDGRTDGTKFIEPLSASTGPKSHNFSIFEIVPKRVILSIIIVKMRFSGLTKLGIQLFSQNYEEEQLFIKDDGLVG